MANPIVITNVSQQGAPAPSTFQRTGAMISQGGTTWAANSLNLLTQLADLTPNLAAAKAITSMALSGGTVTVATTAPHGWTTGDVVWAKISGVTPSAYNGTFQITITGASGFTYPLSGSPGAVSVQGNVTLYAESEILAMATTFFAQGAGLGVYVLELGEGTPAEGVASLQTWITNNTRIVYSYLIPFEWDGVSSYLTFLGGFENTTSQQYFFTTSTPSTYTDYTSQMKCAWVEVPAPVVVSAFDTSALPEFTTAASFFDTLNLNPSSTNKVTPITYNFQYGVTAYPSNGNSVLLTSLIAASTNYVDTGAEGGISTAIIKQGKLRDGNPWTYWYSIDWLSVQSKLALANAVINGANNPQAPLDYDQSGINTLQAVLVGLVGNGVTYGLAVGPIKQTQLDANTFAENVQNGMYVGQLVVNAEPFSVYTAENPSNFADGIYGGFSVAWIPARGFIQIIVNIDATNIV